MLYSLLCKEFFLDDRIFYPSVLTDFIFLPGISGKEKAFHRFHGEKSERRESKHAGNSN